MCVYDNGCAHKEGSEHCQNCMYVRRWLTAKKWLKKACFLLGCFGVYTILTVLYALLLCPLLD